MSNSLRCLSIRIFPPKDELTLNIIDIQVNVLYLYTYIHIWNEISPCSKYGWQVLIVFSIFSAWSDAIAIWLVLTLWVIILTNIFGELFFLFCFLWSDDLVRWLASDHRPAFVSHHFSTSCVKYCDFLYYWQLHTYWSLNHTSEPRTQMLNV